MCGPFPHDSSAGVDKVNKDSTGVIAHSHSSVLPGQAILGAVRKASYVQVRSSEGDQEAERT